MREAARLQTYTHEIEFKGAREDQCIQVGNALPPLLAEVIGNSILKAERNNCVPCAVPKLAVCSLLDLAEKQMPLELETSDAV